MRGLRFVTASVLTFALCLSSAIAQSIQISEDVGDDLRPRISFSLSESVRAGGLVLYRSTRPISPQDLNPIRYPITRFPISEAELSSGSIDVFAADGVVYHYVAAIERMDDGSEFSNVISVARDDVPLPPSLQEPEILIDKNHYVLEVRDSGKVVRTYPVILGRDPVLRKLHQDFRTTPEGIYRITNLKGNSRFHRALDVDYPNRIDRIRYEFLRSQGRVPKDKGIGGEIQVHGQLRNWALERNWTWGCIALRNGDIEELFDHADIKVGTPVYIVGQDITRQDIVSIRKAWTAEKIKGLQSRLHDLGHYAGRVDGLLGHQTRLALGRFQLEKGFPVTCELDKRTVASLLDQPNNREVVPIDFERP